MHGASRGLPTMVINAFIWALSAPGRALGIATTGALTSQSGDARVSRRLGSRALGCVRPESSWSPRTPVELTRNRG